MLNNNRGMTLVELLTTLIIFLLISGAIFTFFIAAMRGAAGSRHAAFGGQAAELAMTHLRTELAGARDVVLLEDGVIEYRRVRDGLIWILELEDKALQRRHVGEDGTEIMVLVRNVEEIAFSIDPETPNMVSVFVRSGTVELEETIFLRNYYYIGWVNPAFFIVL